MAKKIRKKNVRWKLSECVLTKIKIYKAMHNLPTQDLAAQILLEKATIDIPSVK